MFSSQWHNFIPPITSHVAGPYLCTLTLGPSIHFSNHFAPKWCPRAMQVVCTNYICLLCAVPHPYLGDLWSFITDVLHNSEIKQGNIKDGLLPSSCGEATFCYPCQIIIKKIPFSATPPPHHSITCLSDFHRPADFLWACEAAQMQFASYIWVNYLHKFPMFSIIWFLNPGSDDRKGTSCYFPAKPWDASIAMPGWKACTSSLRGG